MKTLKDGSIELAADEFFCHGCTDAVLTDDTYNSCDHCNGKFCKDCGVDNWKGTSWFICHVCREIEPWLEDLIDSLNRQLDAKDDIIKAKEKIICGE